MQVLVQLSQPSSRYQINSLKSSDQALGSWRFLLGKEGFPIKKQVEFKHQVVLSSLSSGPVLRQRGPKVKNYQFKYQIKSIKCSPSQATISLSQKLTSQVSYQVYEVVPFSGNAVLIKKSSVERQIKNLL